MACGLPAIGCRGEGPADYISDNKTGVLVSPQSVRELSKEINKLARNAGLRQQIGERAQRVATYGFSWNQNAKLTEQIFKQSRSKTAE
jgi:glycosyltransferase involved in cell wall biosynthesis